MTLDDKVLVCDGGGIISQSAFLVLLAAFVERLAELPKEPVTDVLGRLLPLTRNAGFARSSYSSSGNAEAW